MGPVTMMYPWDAVSFTFTHASYHSHSH